MNLWLTNYCHPACEPMKNIVRLPRAEAFALAQRLAQANRGDSFYRFADFERYYALRMAQDRALYDAFVALGGRPRVQHPLSFVVGESDYLRQWFGDGPATRIPLSQVPEECISFTLGDSGAIFQRTGAVQVLTKAVLLRRLAEDSSWLEKTLAEHHYHYMEAQLWLEKL